MKQITQTQRNGILHILEVPIPALRPKGVLVRTAYSLISAGTERAKVEVAKKSLLGKALARPDQVRQVIETARQLGLAATYQKVKSRLEAASPLGYSLAGVIVAVGDQTIGLMVGDRVACAGAGYANHAEYVYVPQNLCARIPEGVGWEEAAFCTVGAIALQGFRQARPTIGEVVGVIGLGLLGLLCVQILRSAGCRVVGIDIDSHRCQLARQLGAEVAATPGDSSLEAMVRHLCPWGLDSVILTAATKSSDPIVLAGKLSRDRGRIVVVGDVGMDIPRSPFYEKELKVLLSRSYGPGRYDPTYEEKGIDYPIGYVRWSEGRNLSAFLDLLAQRKVDVKDLITHRFPFEEAPRAYGLIEGKTQEPYLGVVLDYGLQVKDSSVSLPSHSIPVKPAHLVEGKIGLALIGAGNFAQSMLLPHLTSHASIRPRIVITPSGLTARSLAERAGFEQCASDPGAALADPEVGLVVIASRHDSHAELVSAALSAGKAVFVEKPLAISADQLQEVVSAYRRTLDRFQSALLMVGFNRRFAPLVKEMHEFIVGMKEPLLFHYRINAGFIPREHWTQDAEVGAGRIIGEVCHFVDLLMFLVGQPPVEVYAHALPDRGRYSQDNLALILRFANGSTGTITYAANGSKEIEKERLEVFGGGKAVVLNDFRHLTLATAGKIKIKKSPPDKGHRNEMEALVEAVIRGRPSPIPFEQLILATKVTFAILESIRTKQPVGLKDSFRLDD